MQKRASEDFPDSDNPNDAPLYAYAFLKCVDTGVSFDRILETLEMSDPEVTLTEHFGQMRLVADIYRPSLREHIDAFEKKVCEARGLSGTH